MEVDVEKHEQLDNEQVAKLEYELELELTFDVVIEEGEEED